MWTLSHSSTPPSWTPALWNCKPNYKLLFIFYRGHAVLPQQLKSNYGTQRHLLEDVWNSLAEVTSTLWLGGAWQDCPFLTCHCVMGLRDSSSKCNSSGKELIFFLKIVSTSQMLSGEHPFTKRWKHRKWMGSFVGIICREWTRLSDCLFSKHITRCRNQSIVRYRGTDTSSHWTGERTEVQRGSGAYSEWQKWMTEAHSAIWPWPSVYETLGNCWLFLHFTLLRGLPPKSQINHTWCLIPSYECLALPCFLPAFLVLSHSIFLYFVLLSLLLTLRLDA